MRSSLLARLIHERFCCNRRRNTPCDFATNCHESCGLIFGCSPQFQTRPPFICVRSPLRDRRCRIPRPARCIATGRVSLVGTGADVSAGQTVGTRIDAKKGRSIWRLTVTMRTLIPKGPSPSGDVLRQRIRCRSEGDCESSGAQDDGQERAEETAATLTGTSVRLCYAAGKTRSTGHGLAWRARLLGWRLMIFCARATRGLRKPSLDARSGRSISPHP
jgi:hypothetical protein